MIAAARTSHIIANPPVGAAYTRANTARAGGIRPGQPGSLSSGCLPAVGLAWSYMGIGGIRTCCWLECCGKSAGLAVRG